MPTDPVLPESELRSRALQRIEERRLPVMLSTRIDAGYGAEAQCDLCDERAPLAGAFFQKVTTGVTTIDFMLYLVGFKNARRGSIRHLQLHRVLLQSTP